jgi:propanol-preferring alcohol dehydrogenase
VNVLPIPEAGPGQFLVKVKNASLCHSDIMATEAPRDKPVTLGHEGVGYIEKIHPSAEGKGFKVGDAIGSLYINGCCYECEGCLVHNLHCETGKQLLQGFATDGYFAEYVVVDWQNAIILPDSIDIESAAPIFCAGITCKPTLTLPASPANPFSLPRHRLLRTQSRRLARHHRLWWSWSDRYPVRQSHGAQRNRP